MYLDIPQIGEFELDESLLVITDKHGLIQFISTSCVNILDVEPKNTLFKLHYLDLFEPGCKEKIKQEVSVVQKSDQIETGFISANLKIKKGSFAAKIKVNLLRSKHADFKGFLVTVKPDKKHSNTGEEYKKLLDNIPLGIYRTKINGEFVYVNQSFLNLFRYNNNIELGSNNHHLFVDKNYRKSKISEWIEKENYSAEYKAYTKEGKIINIKDEGKVIKDKDGNAAYFDGILEDISKQKEAEEKLQELNLSKDKFLSIISHDLKVPFGQFISATELILEKIDEFDIEQIEKLIRLLNDQAIKSYKLLENLLEWSRNQKGLIEFSPQPVSVYTVVNEAVDGLKQLAESKAITINSSIEKGRLIYADNYMLSTVMRNLISNAIKFTDVNGQINISSKYISGEDAFGDKQLEISVSDTGVGIRKEDIAKLFRIDTAYSSKGTQKESGTGLGLILCNDFVAKHGGKIWVESILDKGSTFKFTIP